MRTVRWHWLAASILLSGCAPDTPEYTPVADVRQLMASVLEPSAEVYWDAVGWILDENGTHGFAPTTTEEWDAVRDAAYVVAESGNLLMMGRRARDQGAWIAHSEALIVAGRQALEAVQARDTLAVFDAGAELYYVCTDCHAMYAAETLRPNARRDTSSTNF